MLDHHPNIDDAITAISNPEPAPQVRGGPGDAGSGTPIALVRYASEDEPWSAKAGEMPWQVLLAWLQSEQRTGPCTLARCAGKVCPHKSGAAWSPVVLSTPYRANEYVKAVTAFVTDIDDVGDWQWLGRLEADGLALAMYSTHTHRASKPRVRPIIPLSRPVLAAEYPRFLRAVVERYQLPADPQCKDLSRLYYLPATPIGVEPIFLHRDGKALDVDEILAFARPEPERPAPEPARASKLSAEELAELARDNEADERLIQVLGACWPAEKRHAAHMALAGTLARLSWDSDRITRVLVGVAEIEEPGNGDEQKRASTAAWAVSHVDRPGPKGEGLPGWPTLMKHVGVGAVREARKILGLPRYLTAAERAESDARWEAWARDLETTCAPVDLAARALEAAKHLGRGYEAHLLRLLVDGGERLEERADLEAAALAAVKHVDGVTSQWLRQRLGLLVASTLCASVDVVVDRAFMIGVAK